LHIPDLLVHDFRLFLQSIPGLSNLQEIRLTLGKTMENSLAKLQCKRQAVLQVGKESLSQISRVAAAQLQQQVSKS